MPPKKISIPKNSDTCLVIKPDDRYHVFRNLTGLIEITCYQKDEIYYRNALILDHMTSVFLDIENNLNKIGFSFGGSVEDDITFIYDEFRHANQVYDFCLKCYCAYKTIKLAGATIVPTPVAPKKKKIRSPLRKVSDKVDVGVDSASKEAPKASKEAPKASKEAPSATKINNGTHLFPDTKSLPTPSLRSNLYPVLNEKFDFPEPPSYDPEQPLIML